MATKIVVCSALANPKNFPIISLARGANVAYGTAGYLEIPSLDAEYIAFCRTEDDECHFSLVDHSLEDQDNDQLDVYVTKGDLARIGELVKAEVLHYGGDVTLEIK